MKKNYIRYTVASRQAAAKKSRIMELFFIIVLMGIVGALIIETYASKHEIAIFSKQTVATSLEEMKSFLPHKNQRATHPQPAVTTMQLATNAPAEPEIQFDFYHELPKQQVEMPIHTVQAVNTSTNEEIPAKQKINNSPPPLPQQEAKYILQIGVFANEAAASRIRLSLLLAGLDATIMTTKLNDKVVYQIQRGSYVSIKQAKAAQRILQKKGIESIIKQTL